MHPLRLKGYVNPPFFFRDENKSIYFTAFVFTSNTFALTPAPKTWTDPKLPLRAVAGIYSPAHRPAISLIPHTRHSFPPFDSSGNSNGKHMKIILKVTRKTAKSGNFLLLTLILNVLGVAHCEWWQQESSQVDKEETNTLEIENQEYFC